jgi:hypothetical protein
MFINHAIYIIINFCKKEKKKKEKQTPQKPAIHLYNINFFFFLSQVSMLPNVA